ncbi:MAG: hypothetical protein GX640_11820 [Fibrobacter sp.]|nr:hypothetical protein [Fibrobacter sp.]
MSELFGKTIFPKQYGKLEKNRQVAKSEPLKMKEINTLLSMRFNNEPIFPSIEHFYSDEYKKELDAGKSSSELESIVKFRPATDQEANLLYCDIHERDEKFQYSGGGAQTE